MEIFEKIGDTIVSAGKDVTEKAKEHFKCGKIKDGYPRKGRLCGETVCADRKEIL